MRAQYIKGKLDRSIRKQEKITLSQYKAPDLNSIISRNCNILIDPKLVVAQTHQGKEYGEMGALGLKPYSVEEMLKFDNRSKT